MSDQDIFANDVQNDPQEYLPVLVGEGRKYADPEALAKAAYHQLKHIERVESEAAALRQEMQHRLSLEEFVDKMKPQQERQAPPPVAPVLPDQRANGLTPEDLDKAVETRLQAREAESRRQTNARLVREALQKQFGPDINSVVKARAAELGLSDADMADQAQTRPQAFLALFEGYNRRTDAPVAPPNGAVDPLRFRPNASSVKNWAYYERMRVQDPKAYLTSAIQNEIHVEAERQGPSFFQ